MALMLTALIIMPLAFLYFAVKMGLTPLNAVCLALLTSTAFSTGCWTIVNGPDGRAKVFKTFEAEYQKQLVLVEEQLKAQKHDGKEIQEALEVLRDKFQVIAEVSKPLVPSAMLFCWHLVTLIIIYYVAVRVAPLIGKKVDSLPPFKEWRFDWNLIWLFITGWVLFFLVGGINDLPVAETIRTVGANCFMMSSVLYSIAGFSILFFLFDKYKVGTFNRVVLSLIALLLSQFIVWLGIIDVWAEIRKRLATQEVSDDSEDR